MLRNLNFMQFFIQTYIAFLLMITSPDSVLIESEKAYFNEDWKKLELLSSELIYNGYEDYQIFFYKTMSLAKQGKQKEAHFFLNNINAYYKLESWKVNYLHAIVSENEYNEDEFIRYMKLAISENVEFADAYNELGYYYYNKGDYKNALPYFKKAYEINSVEIVYLHNLAITYNKLGHFNSSLYYAQKCIDVDPNFIAAYELKADIEVGNKNYNSALANYELIKEYLPENTEIYIKSGYCHAQLGQYDSSCENFEFAEKKGNLLAEDLISLYCK